MTSGRYCSNCRAELPRGESSCPQCGVYAGDVFDGRLPGWRRKRIRLAVLIVLLFAVAGVAVWVFRSDVDLLSAARDRVITRSEEQSDPPLPVRVVGDRPGGARRGTGAALNEAEAIRLVRRHLATGGRSTDCVALMSRGYRDGGYVITAFDRCETTRLGDWRVDGTSGAITRPGLP